MIIRLISFLSIFFALLVVGLQNQVSFESSQPITIQNLSKKWMLEEYSYMSVSVPPGKQEVGDYIKLQSTMKFESVSDGSYEEGEWKFDQKGLRITLSNKKDKEELVLNVEKLTSNQLTASIDDPTDKESHYLKIIFKAN